MGDIVKFARPNRRACSQARISRLPFALNAMLNLSNTPCAERKETGSEQLENEASSALFTRVRNMAAHGSVSRRLFQSLTEEDIRGASLQGRNPTALKTDEIRFWLKCRGDPA